MNSAITNQQAASISKESLIKANSIMPFILLGVDPRYKDEVRDGIAKSFDDTVKEARRELQDALSNLILDAETIWGENNPDEFTTLIKAKAVLKANQ
jgi:hypothetical protein